MALSVTSGIYRFFSRAELDAERLRYMAEVKRIGSTLVGASVNGQSYTFNVQGRELPLEAWGDAIADAYNQLGVFNYGTPTPNRTVSRF